MRPISRRIFRHHLYASLVFLISCAPVGLLIKRLEESRVAEKRENLYNLVTEQGHIIQNHIELSLARCYSLAAMLYKQKGDTSGIEAMAIQMLQFDPDIAIGIAPSGTIRSIFPREGHEDLLNRTIRTDSLFSENNGDSLDEKSITLTRPFISNHEKLEALGYLPIKMINKNGKLSFWGDIVVVLHFPEALDSENLSIFTREDFWHGLYLVDRQTGQRLPISVRSGVSPDMPVEKELRIANSVWVLSAAPIKGWADDMRGFLFKIGIGALFCLLMGYLAKVIMELKTHKQDLETLVRERTEKLALQVKECLQVEKALVASKEIAEKYLNVAAEIIISLDTTGRIVLLNESGHLLLGYAPGELIGRNWFDVSLPDGERAKVRAVFDRLVSGTLEQIANYENPIVTKDGIRKIILWHNTLIRDEAGAITGILSSGEDITKRKEAEELLRIQHDLMLEMNSFTNLRLGLNTILMAVLKIGGMDCGGIYLADPRDNALTLVAHHGLSEEFIAKTSHYSSNSPNVRLVLTGQAHYSPYASIRPEPDAIREKEGLRAIAVIPVMFQARLVAVLNMASHVYDAIPGSTQVALETVALQIGGVVARLRSQSALRESEQKFRSYLECAPDGVLIVDGSGRFLEINPAGCRITGYSKEEIAERSISSLLADESRPEGLAHFKKVMETGAATADLWHVRKDGSKRYLTVDAVMLSEGKVLGFLKDITERKKAEEAAAHHQAQLIQAEKMASLGILITGIAHEINNPNNFIMLNADIFASVWNDSISFLDSHFAEYGDFKLGGIPYSHVKIKMPRLIQGLKEGADRIAGIVHGLKDYVRPDSGNMNAEVDMKGVLNDAQVILKNLIDTSTDHFSCTVEPSLPLVRGNRQQLEQVVINLISNACQALENRKQAIQVGVWYNAGDRVVEFSVSDEGRGIRDENKAYIFDPFFTTKRDSGGTGLGLSIVASIVKAHLGTIDFESVPGKGTRFTFSLPIAQEQNV